MSEELIKRLLEHAAMHEQYIPFDDEQAQFAKDLREAADALSRPAPAVQVPEGWRLVPVEPTKAMLDAGRWEEFGEESSHLYPVDDIAVGGVWECMVKAAPSAPSVAHEAGAQGGVDVDILSRPFELNMSNYGPDDVDTLQAWALDAYDEIVRLRALLSAPPAASVRPDCGTCANRGRVDGLSQESHCEHCCWQELWRTSHYAPAIANQEPK